MKRASKGVIDVSTSNNIKIRKSKPFDDFTIDSVKIDLINAAETSNFFGSDNKPINFELVDETINDIGNVHEKTIHFRMKNFEGVNFADSFKDALEERQIAFKAWSKFYSHLSKLGYTIK